MMKVLQKLLATVVTLGVLSVGAWGFDAQKQDKGQQQRPPDKKEKEIPKGEKPPPPPPRNENRGNNNEGKKGKP